MRSISRAIAIVPAYQLGALRVPGPDEDTFTLAAAGLEAISRPARDAPTQLHLVGDYPVAATWGLPTLLGSSRVVLHRYPPGSLGLFQALVRAAQDPPASGPVIVVAAEIGVPRPDEPAPSFGGGAVAFRVEEAAGIVPLAVETLPSIAQSEVSPKSNFDPRGAPSSPTEEGIAASLQLPAAPPQSTNRSKEGSARPFRGWGDAPTIGPAIGLRQLVRQVPLGALGSLEVHTAGSTNRLTVRRIGEAQWIGPFSEVLQEGIPISESIWRRSFDRASSGVSEGAYVPRPRYIENLPSRWRFTSSRCSACGTYALPPQEYCRRCHATQGFATEELPRDGGTILASTTIGPGGQPTEFDAQVELTGAYQVVLMEIAPGVRVTLQVTDAPTRLPIGGQADTRLRRLYPMEGEWRYGRKAIPFDPQATRGGDAPLESWTLD